MTNATQREESAERLARPLIQLAKASGLSTSFFDQLGTYTEISDEALVAVLAALGIDASTDEAIAHSLELHEEKQRNQLIPPTIVATTGRTTTVEINCSAECDITASITLEDGTTFDEDIDALPDLDSAHPTIAIPGSLPMGYHTLHVSTEDRDADATIINAPAHIAVPEAVADHHRWGWMTQMYSVRSHESWGVGDYGDLKRLLADAATKSGADFMLINPIHASAPLTPLEPSPYLPESRRFLNVTYIRPQDIPEYAELDAEALSLIHI